MVYHQCSHSGQVPQFGGRYGPAIAASAYTPECRGSLVVVEGFSGLAIASPPIV